MSKQTSVIVFVEGVLLAAILATWMWTWWWNRYVVSYRPEPDYDAAIQALTSAIIRPGNRLLIEAHRARVAREVVDAAFASGAETTGEIEVVSHYGLTYEKYLADMVPRQQ